jgi:peroxiredoxin
MYTVLSDTELQAAKKFGLAYKVDSDTFKKLKGFGIDLEKTTGNKHRVLPVPGVFLVDTDGTIQFSYANPDYTVRLSPEVLLAAAKAGSEPKKK